MDEKEVLKKKISEAMDGIRAAEAALTEIMQQLDLNVSMDIPYWLQPRVRLWCIVYGLEKEGIELTKDDLHFIWEDIMHKDVRGLGGFFVGKNRSLTWKADGKTPTLTKEANETMRYYLSKSLEDCYLDYKEDIEKVKAFIENRAKEVKK